MYLESSMSKNSRIFKLRTSITEWQSRFTQVQQSKIVDGVEGYGRKNYELYLADCRKNSKEIKNWQNKTEHATIVKEKAPNIDKVLNDFIKNKNRDEKTENFIKNAISEKFKNKIMSNRMLNYKFLESQLSARLNESLLVKYEILRKYQYGVDIVFLY